MTAICVDAGPLENAHRGRGIGTVVREILRALDAVVPLPATIQYLSRRPVEGLQHLRWSRRSRTAEWTGVGEVVPSLRSAMWQAVETAAFLPRDISRSDCDVFLATDPWATPRSKRCRTVAVVYDLIPLLFPTEYLKGLRRAPRRALLRIALARVRRADRLIAISEATRQDVVRLLGVPSDRVDVVHLAVDREVFRPLAAEGRQRVKARFGLDEDFFLYVGEFDARKNIPSLVDAFRIFRGHQKGVRLVLAGASDRSRMLLESELAARGVATDGILFTGHVAVEELVALYSSATALVYPSQYEGFGLPVLEAMSCGAPVLTSPVSSMPEIAGNAALYAEPRDAQALSNGMTRLMEDPTLRRNLTEAGLARARTFSWDTTARAILASCDRSILRTPS